MVSEISFGTMTFSDVDKAATGSGRGDSGEAAYAMLEACYKVRAVPPRAHLLAFAMPAHAHCRRNAPDAQAHEAREALRALGDAGSPRPRAVF